MILLQWSSASFQVASSQKRLQENFFGPLTEPIKAQESLYNYCDTMPISNLHFQWLQSDKSWKIGKQKRERERERKRERVRGKINHITKWLTALARSPCPSVWMTKSIHLAHPQINYLLTSFFVIRCTGWSLQ